VTRAISAFCAIVFLASAGAPAGAANFSVTRVSGGSIVRQDDPAADLIGTQVRISAGLDRQSADQNGLAALVAQSILQTPADGVPLADSIAGDGGSIAYDVDPHDVRFYLEGLPGSYDSMLARFHAALAHPDFSAPALTRARAALGARIERTQQFPLTVGLQMLNRTFYTDSNAGMPPLGLPQTIAGFVTADAQAFFSAHYLRGGAVVSAAGKLSGIAPSSLETLLGALGPGTSLPVNVSLKQLPSNTRQLIARRDIPVPWLVAQYKAPDLQSRDFGPMLVLTSFLERTLSDVAGVPTLSTPSSSERGVGATYNFDTQPANVVVYVDGGGNPTQVFATALTIVNVLGHAKLAGDLTDMKTFAIGRFLDQSVTLRDRAWLAGTFVGRRLGPDYSAQAIAAIEKTTASDLQRVAVRYLGFPNIALVLPRDQQGSSP
jgi:predicted Zn-dependent peptidase